MKTCRTVRKRIILICLISTTFLFFSCSPKEKTLGRIIVSIDDSSETLFFEDVYHVDIAMHSLSIVSLKKDGLMETVYSDISSIKITVDDSSAVFDLYALDENGAVQDSGSRISQVRTVSRQGHTLDVRFDSSPDKNIRGNGDTGFNSIETYRLALLAPPSLRGRSLSSDRDGQQRSSVSIGEKEYLVLSVDDKNGTALLLQKAVSCSESLSGPQIPYNGSEIDTSLETDEYSKLSAILGEKAILLTQIEDSLTRIEEDRKLKRHVFLLALEDVFSLPAEYEANDSRGFIYDRNANKENTSGASGSGETVAWNLRTAFSSSYGYLVQSDGKWGYSGYLEGVCGFLRPAFSLDLSSVVLIQTDDHYYRVERRPNP